MPVGGDWALDAAVSPAPHAADEASCGNGCASWQRRDRGSATGGCTCCCSREGVIVNHKRVERLYREEGLAVRRRRRKRVARDGRGRAAVPGRPNQQWGVDFVSDALAWGRRIRLFTVVDVFTREALAIEVDTSLPGGRVVRVLERLVAERGVPDEIVLDNGPELAGKARRSVGLRARGVAALHRAGQAGPERLRRELSGTTPRRMSRPPLVRWPERCPAHDRGLAAGLQSLTTP